MIEYNQDGNLKISTRYRTSCTYSIHLDVRGSTQKVSHLQPLDDDFYLFNASQSLEDFPHLRLHGRWLVRGFTHSVLDVPL